MTTVRRGHQGVTLLELLVAISISGILVSILLPAVQAARECARRTACANNLKQIGLALHNHEATVKAFPPGGVGYGWCQNPQQGGARRVQNLNGLVFLLPFLEQNNLSEKLDRQQCTSNLVEGNNICCSPTTSLGVLAGDAVTSGNAALVSKKLAVFACPSEGGDPYLPEGGIYGIKTGGGYQGVKTNYDFCASADIACNAWSNSPRHMRRMFGHNSRTTFAQLADGASNTVAVAETLYDVYNGRTAGWGYRAWAMVGVDFGAYPINRWEGPGVSRQSGRLFSWGHPGSMHPGGAHVLLADGAVRFVSESVDASLQQHLAAMDDGQVVAWP